MEHEANDTSRERAIKTREVLKNKGIKSPDLSTLFPVKIDRTTTIYVKTKERQKQLIKENAKTNIPKPIHIPDADYINRTCGQCKHKIIRPKNTRQYGCKKRPKNGDDFVTILVRQRACEMFRG